MHRRALLVLLLCGGLICAWAGASGNQAAALAAAAEDDGRAQPAPGDDGAGRLAPSPQGLGGIQSQDEQAAAPAPPPAPTVTGGEALRAKQRLVISGAGDTNLDPNYIPAFRTEGYAYAFSGLQDLFAKDDLTVVNLECAASALGAAVPKEFNFNCDPAALPVMKAAGVEVANLANNHSGDYGPAALVDTRANVAAAGLAPVGVGRNDAEAEAPALFDVKGWKIAVLGFGGVIPDPSWVAGPNRPGMADGDTTERMVAAVERAEAQADLVVVAIHWGVELDTTPRADDVERARAMIDAGADVIFGHHSHRLNPLETIAGKPVAWGLGNFVWPRLSDAGATTAVAQVIVEPDGTMTSCLVPTFIERHGHPVVQVPYQGECRW